MLRAVFVRTLKPGVTYEQFKDAWVPREDERRTQRLERSPGDHHPGAMTGVAVWPPEVVGFPRACGGVPSA